MVSLLSDFGQTTQRLVRNPLGIIAIFIFLVYGIAGLVLGYSAGDLQPSEKLPMIWFLVIFPVVVLAAFLWLVSCHHEKLYAPSDFPDKEGFFRAQTPVEQKQHIDAEVEEIQSETNQDTSERLDVSETIAVRHDYILAEELAFREIEGEFGVPVLRNVALGTAEINGVLNYKGKRTAIEIKFRRRPSWKRLIGQTIDRFDRILESHGSIPVILAIVTEGLTEERRKRAISEARVLSQKSSRPLKLKLYDFGELKKKYGFEV